MRDRSASGAHGHSHGERRDPRRRLLRHLAQPRRPARCRSDTAARWWCRSPPMSSYATRALELVDLGVHRLRDLGEPEHVFQVRHPDLESDFPPLRSLDAFPTNLPLQPTTFVGRDDDVEDVVEALRHSRARHPDRRRWCRQDTPCRAGCGGSPASLSRRGVALRARPAELARGIARRGRCDDRCAAATRAVDDRAVCSPRSRSRELLVVLDNCEHLLDAAAQLVADFLASCPGVSVLATGREGLGVRGERMMMVRSLPLPSEGARRPQSPRRRRGAALRRARRAGGR